LVQSELHSRFETLDIKKKLHHRVFLARKSHTRFDENLENKAQAILRRDYHQNNFELINPNKLSIVDQMCLFSDAHVIVDLHGGALTNMIFRKKALAFLNFL
jgi:capsular polysaccharide biosynthesis protein